MSARLVIIISREAVICHLTGSTDRTQILFLGQEDSQTEEKLRLGNNCVWGANRAQIDIH
eukprot:scaffold4978_cov122-Skeletonema_dohrnii-CCMP3373.AAC.3